MTHELYEAELKNPTPEEKRLERSVEPAEMVGFWRINSARTKTDWPVAIWTEDGESGPVTIFKIGEGKGSGSHPTLFNTVDHPERVAEFCETTWLRCTAVSQDDYFRATNLAIKTWPDGKDALKRTDDEKLDIVPSTPADQGGNMPEEADGLHEQIVTKIENLIEKAGKFSKITTLDEANDAAAVLEPLRKLGQKGEARRKEEKQPHLDAGAAVDAKWSIIKTASDVVKKMVDAIEAFRRAEQKRIADEQRREREAEQRRLAEEAAQRLREEAAQRAAEAAEAGDDTEEQPSDEEIEAQAAAEAAEKIAEQPQVQAEAPRVGTAHGRAVSKAKRARAIVHDFEKLALALLESDDSELKSYLQKRADAAARAKIKLAGMEIVEE